MSAETRFEQETAEHPTCNRVTGSAEGFFRGQVLDLLEVQVCGQLTRGLTEQRVGQKDAALAGGGI